MKKSILNRILLLLTVLLAAYQVVVCSRGSTELATLAYTAGFGLLVVSGIMMIILGYETMNNHIVVLVSTWVPLAISLGLVNRFIPDMTAGYLVFSITGFILVGITRLGLNRLLAAWLLPVVHGISGLIICILPVVLSIRGATPVGFAWVGIGGALMGTGGLVLSSLRAGKPIFSPDTILAVVPVVMLLSTAAFVLGFGFL